MCCRLFMSLGCLLHRYLRGHTLQIVVKRSVFYFFTSVATAIAKLTEAAAHHYCSRSELLEKVRGCGDCSLFRDNKITRGALSNRCSSSQRNFGVEQVLLLSRTKRKLWWVLLMLILLLNLLGSSSKTDALPLSLSLNYCYFGFGSSSSSGSG